jgi:adenylate cyclase
LVLHLRTLHPELFARTVALARGEPVEIRDREEGSLVLTGFEQPVRLYTIASAEH